MGPRLTPEQWIEEFDKQDRLIAELREENAGLRSESADKTLEIQRLKVAIRKHRDQKADDRCWMDDVALYETLGDGVILDNHVGDKDAMLANCSRFIANRCSGGIWKSYAELEAENDELHSLVSTGFDVPRVLAWQQDPHRKPAQTAFTSGGERAAADLVEMEAAKWRDRLRGIDAALVEYMEVCPVDQYQHVDVILDSVRAAIAAGEGAGEP